MKCENPKCEKEIQPPRRFCSKSCALCCRVWKQETIEKIREDNLRNPRKQNLPSKQSTFCLCCGKSTWNPKFCSKACSGKMRDKRSEESYQRSSATLARRIRLGEVKPPPTPIHSECALVYCQCKLCQQTFISYCAKRLCSNCKSIQIQSVVRSCVVCAKLFDVPYRSSVRLTCSKACFHIYLSQQTKGRSGGLRLRGGRGKQGYYRGVHFNSTWELAYFIWAQDHGFDIKRSYEALPIEIDGEVFKFYPDFRVNGKFVEIKGPQDPRAAIKKAQTVGLVEFIEDITLYYDYCISQGYPKALETLYERSSIGSP